MIDYKLLEALAAVVEGGSFEAAARKLHLTQSAVSQRVKQFEIQMGQPLIHRGPPPVATELGSKLIAHHQQVAALEQELAPGIGSGEEQDFVKVAVALNNDSLYYWFLEAVTPVLKRRKVVLELLVNDEGKTDEWLRAGQAYAAISSSVHAPHGCSSSPLGGMQYLCVATKRFRKEYFPKGVDRDALKNVPFIIFDRNDTLHDEFLQKYFRLQQDSIPHFAVPAAKGFLQLVLNDCAYALVPEIEVRPYLKRGRLVELTPGRNMYRELYWHTWFVQPALHREIGEAIARYAAEKLTHA